jgi:hypothetical protein
MNGEWRDAILFVIGSAIGFAIAFALLNFWLIDLWWGV